MPKLKSHSGAKKRFTKTAGGNWKHRKPGLRHLLIGMPAEQGRTTRRGAVISKSSPEGKLLKKALPYD